MIKLLVPFFLVLSGCIPITRDIRVAPAINGQILRDGKGVSNLSVSYSLDQDIRCSNPIGTSITSNTGNFSFPSRTERADFISLIPAETFYRWNLCFSGSEGITGAWSANSVGPSNAPEILVVECEVSRSPSEWCRTK